MDEVPLHRVCAPELLKLVLPGLVDAGDEEEDDKEKRNKRYIEPENSES